MSNKPGILVIDDEIEVGIFFKRLLESKGYFVGVAANGDEAKSLWERYNFQVAMVDLKLPDIDGLTLLQRIKEVQPACEVIIMTGYATTRTAVKAIQLGAFDYVEKPFEEIAEIEDLVQKAMDYGSADKTAGSRPRWAHVADRVGLYYGQSEEMHRLLTIAERIAPKDINVLIQGETGTGKEVLARFVHAASARADQEFVAVNCGAVPESLLESHLFGHEKGAFTGATTTHRGIFEIANNGTLFLDEIGEASPSIQVKLLRVLETGEFRRVGGEKPIRTNVRLISATNVDLEQAVKEKKFREDLFYRLDVIRLILPPLRQRSADIPGLVHHFFERLGLKEEKPYISPEVMERLCNYTWPGNLRELLNTVNQVEALRDGEMITLSHLPEKILQAGKGVTNPGQDSRQDSHSTIYKANAINYETMAQACQLLENHNILSNQELLNIYRKLLKLKKDMGKSLAERGVATDAPTSLRDMEAKAIEEALAYYGGNVTAASKALGVGRNTLYRKAKEYNIQMKN
ncbi:sigma-54-dependent transcriptional regulator [Desulfofalx alkaliphila]|uniref:sigma-54-dependent transcriptional regulator n=1 Tax=Desulfofalx alkaliphila TaxID=105483 RepID=UPI0004E10F52|nr:sigma-54 dependent transcriptional regulator [Desulfofalx alkaliphila]